jgi:IS30 family transposase
MPFWYTNEKGIMSYNRVTWEDSIRIKLLLEQGKSNTEIAKVIRKVGFEINNRPIKCLDWKTPYEVMMKKKLH